MNRIGGDHRDNIKTFAIALPTMMLALQLFGWISFIPIAWKGYPDFRQLYTASHMVRTGHSKELYDYQAQMKFQNLLVGPAPIALPFNHLAYEALLFLPFSWVSYRAAYLLFLALNLFLLAVSSFILRSHLSNIGDLWEWLPFLMFVSFLPVATALMKGQDSIILMTLLVVSLVYLFESRDLMAGALVGLGLFKFQIVIPILLLFLIWRSWRFSAGFLASSVVVGLVSLKLVGYSQLRLYAPTTPWTSSNTRSIQPGWQI